MATVSFDEKVTVTDPETVAKMCADLDSQTPANQKRKTTAPKVTMAEVEENAKEWAEIIRQSH